MLTDFKVTVVNGTGRPIPGAAVRLVSTLPLTDVTISLFGQSPVYTGPDGIYRYEFGVSYTSLGIGLHIIYASAPGYDDGQIETEQGFQGIGHYTVTLTRSDVDSSVGTAAKTGGLVCPMYPVPIDVDAAAPDATWEFIETTVQDEKGVDSVIENNIVQGKARVNIQSRLRLKPQLNLVGDNTAAATDPDFSGKFSVSFASVTSAGTVSIGTPYTYKAANAFPQSDDTNDLTSFTNETGPASWLSPWGVSWGRELPVFDGQYADAMVWLTKLGAGNYSLKAQYYDINRIAFANTNDVLPAALFAAQKAVRIRIPQASASIYYAQITVQLGGVDQTKPLYVRYIHA